jgi:hypothetical protein
LLLSLQQALLSPLSVSHVNGNGSDAPYPALLIAPRKTAKDPMIKDLAGNALKFVEKFVKKAPTPVESASAK